MNTNRPLLRDAIGFLVGGLVAALASGLVFLAFFPLPPPDRNDHTREALSMLVFFSFMCGGFIGRRAFSADFFSQLLLPVVVSYAVIVFLCVLASLDFLETVRTIGLASAGILASNALLFLLGQRFPAKSESCEP